MFPTAREQPKEKEGKLGELKKFTLEGLAKYDGREGRQAYIAYKGKVYDVSESWLWEDGDHQGLHEAGKDLKEWRLPGFAAARPVGTPAVPVCR